jgi:pyruvate carboxylase
MRAVRRAADLPAAFERCRSEAERAFGNGAVYLEQLLTGAKHVEVQIVGDGSGAISQVGYRECSVQRRHQKPVEMAPCSTLPMTRRKPLLDGPACWPVPSTTRASARFEVPVDATGW